MSTSDSLHIGKALVDAGFLPNASAADTIAELLDADPTTNLLPALAGAWRLAEKESSSKASRVRRLTTWLARSLDDKASLTWGVPGRQRFSRWVGQRLCWWPQGVPDGQYTSVASSRLGRTLETHDDWFETLRYVVAAANRDGHVLVVSDRTAPATYVERCSELFGGRLLRIRYPRGSSSRLTDWLKHATNWNKAETTESRWSLFLSPELETNQLSTEFNEIPNRDRALVAIGDHLIVLKLRRGGNLDFLLRARLNDDSFSPGSTKVACRPKLTDTKLLDELLRKGVVGWCYAGPSPSNTKELPSSPYAAASQGQNRSSMSGMHKSREWPFLTHCTRRRHGPWPNQSRDEYLDDYILQRSSRDHSALAALRRMARERRIVASADGIRGGTCVVSWTAVPLDELHHLRVFRAHRGRWDFEPFGLCVRSDWLRQAGARPVVYATHEQWSRLTETEKPFFQIATTRSESSDCDWTVEQEWRHLGDVLLDSLSADDAFFFVPTVQDARQLANDSPFPIQVLEST